MTIPPKVKKLVEQSGNTFHASVVRAFREKQWHTVVSPYYLDSQSEKSREIDLVAEKRWQIPGMHAQQTPWLHFKLFVECKYIANDTVLWFDTRDAEATREWLRSNTPLNEQKIYLREHHYLANDSKVAKLFASANSRSGEGDPFYRALNQVLHAMVHLRGRGTTLSAAEDYTYPEAMVELLVILCNSLNRLYAVDISDPKSTRKVDTFFQLEVNYAYLDPDREQRTEYFLVDVVPLDGLGDYFSALAQDRNAMAGREL